MKNRETSLKMDMFLSEILCPFDSQNPKTPKSYKYLITNLYILISWENIFQVYLFHITRSLTHESLK